MAQLDDASRKKLHKNLNTRIEQAYQEIKKITTVKDEETGGDKKIPYKELSTKVQKQVDYLYDRINNFQVSLRLAFNMNWLIEQRNDDIKTLAERIKTEFGPGFDPTPEATKEERTVISKLNQLTKATQCKRKGCYTGRGYTGMNVSTGEFILCKCTLDTLHLYKLHD